MREPCPGGVGHPGIGPLGHSRRDRQYAACEAHTDRDIRGASKLRVPGSLERRRLPRATTPHRNVGYRWMQRMTERGAMQE
jgi:hypothetical protein